MSLFIDTLPDDDGAMYDYGHCCLDSDDGTETGCGMEYAYYPQFQRLEYWHDSVGLVSYRYDFTQADADNLDRLHDECHSV